MSKKVLALVLTALMSTSLMVGCKTTSKTDVPTVASDVLTELKLPIVTSPLTIKYWRPNDAKIVAWGKGFGDVKAYQEKAKITGITADFQSPPVGQQADAFNLMIASNQLPDVIYYNWGAANGGPSKALADGRIIKLNEYVDKYAPNLKKLLTSDPELKKQCMLDDGTIYMFPYIRTDSVKLNATWGFQVRQDWLDNVSLKAPTTIDEWHTVLTAFKDKDPNKNGKADEVPFTAKTGIVAVNDFAPAWGVLGAFMQKSGKVAYGCIDNNYKPFLETMAAWYKEKLIDQEYATNDAKAFDYKVTNNIAGSYNGAIISGMGRLTGLVKPTTPNFKLTGVQWPVGTDGKSYVTGRLDTKALPYGEAITSSAKPENIKAIVQWMDFNYSKQGSMLMNFGIEGESYKMVDGYPTYTDQIFKNPNKLSYDQALAQYAISIMDGPMNQDSRYLDQMLQLPEQKAANATWMKGDGSLGLPSLQFTTEEATKISSVMSQINTYQTEMLAKFVMGKEPLTGFDKYVQTIKGMGIDDIVKIHQAALDRFNARK